MSKLFIFLSDIWRMNGKSFNLCSVDKSILFRESEPIDKYSLKTMPNNAEQHFIALVEKIAQSLL